MIMTTPAWCTLAGHGFRGTWKSAEYLQSRKEGRAREKARKEAASKKPCDLPSLEYFVSLIRSSSLVCGFRENIQV